MSAHVIEAVRATRNARRSRLRLVVAILAAALVAVAVLTVLVDYSDSEFVLGRIRLPRLAIGVVAGLAFGVAGAMFQSLFGNPLASPDIIGISGGASAGAVGALLLLDAGGLAVTGAALGGGLLVAAFITASAWRGGVVGGRFVLIGIGCAFFAQALIGYLLTRADVREARSALVWLVGSLGSIPWSDVALTGGIVAALLAGAALLSPRLRMLSLGDDAASALGVPVTRSRLALLAIAVGLAAVATASVGPIAFVAFVSAPIARRLTADGGAALGSAGLVGAVLVSASDLVAQYLVPGATQVPVGIVTSVVGAPYLLWLLARRNRGGIA